MVGRLRPVTLSVHHFLLPFSGCAPIIRRVLHSRLAFSVALFAVALGSLIVVDSVGVRTDAVNRGLVGIDSTHRARALVLLVDGLRYETAADPQMMPALSRLRAAGASGKVETVFEGFSIPAIRAALSGKAETQLMNAIRNFHFTALPTESVFLDARTAGKTALVIGDEPFTQFGPYFERRLPAGQFPDMYASDRVRPAIALAAYAAESQDLVVCHYESGDWIGHEFGIHRREYAAEFLAIDSVVARFAAARRPGDYLFVFGDHGHNETGEHKTGLYIPTFGLFIGPDITPGIVFPSLQITNIRLLLSHALGIQLHESEYQLGELSRFLPIAAATTDRALDDVRPNDHAIRDYVWCALFLVLAALLFVAAAPGEAATRPDYTTIFLVGLIFLAELIAQQHWDSAWSAFPFLLLVVATTMARRDRWGALVIVAIGLFFVSRFSPGGDSGSLLRVPYAIAQLIPLYAAGIVAKLFIFLAVTGRRHAFRAMMLTLALSLLEFRVWDHPAFFLAAIAVSIVAIARTESGPSRQTALIAFGYATLVFTLRLPLYEYAWIDLLLVSVFLARRSADRRWTDALVISGAFTLTSVWLRGGLEWSFLYGLMPAYVVELHVIWFLPLILLKLPLLLGLVWWITDTPPSREFVSAMLAYTGLRFIAVWAVRLGGGTGVEMWPLAERGMYLLTFAIATVWFYRTHQDQLHSAETRGREFA